MESMRTREELVHALAVGAELEQGLCLQYLFTAFSLKDEVSEGLSPRELTFVRKWKANIFLVAAQEMLHLAQAANLSTAVGGTLHLRRPNFPQRSDYYPTHLPWGLFPFSEQTMRLYACYERPERMSAATRSLLGPCELGLEREARMFHDRPDRFQSKRQHQFLPDRYQRLRPRATQAETIGELYAAIQQAYETLMPPSGELLIGDPALQIYGPLIDFPQVMEVHSRNDAVAAIDLIVRQGEGAPEDRIDSHFGVFVTILREYLELKENNPAFEPSRNVHPNPLSRLHVDNTYPGWRLIHDDFTRAVNDLCTGVYETMVMMLFRLFATRSDAPQQRLGLARNALRLMTTAIKPLGEALTRLPMGDDGSKGAGQRPDRAGPSFEVDRAIELTSDGRAAWVQIWERLLELSVQAKQLADDPRAVEPEHRVSIAYLRNAAEVLGSIEQSFGSRPPKESP